MVDLEQLAEDIKNEADELDSVVQHLKTLNVTTRNQFDSIINNFKDFSDLVYRAYEDIGDISQNIDDIKNMNAILLQILKNTLSYDDLLYYSIIYGLDRELFW